MKTAIIGYGKMGHAVERVLLDRGHEITCRIDAGDGHLMASPEFAASDVAIEFSRPTTATDNFRQAFAAGVPVVSGTTGWTAAMPEVRQLVQSEGATLLWSSNFSIGVNIFLRLNTYLAHLMSRFPEYLPSMSEVHHIHKLDHPSGTAISIADAIEHAHPLVTHWAEKEEFLPEPEHGTLPIAHRREGEVPGTHTVRWSCGVDEITLEHRAFSRDGFALGAVMAAEWVVSHPERSGMLTMADFLGF